MTGAVVGVGMRHGGWRATPLPHRYSRVQTLRSTDRVAGHLQREPRPRRIARLGQFGIAEIVHASIGVCVHWLFWCRGRESNPHAPFGTQDFKPSPAVLRSERAGVNCGFQLQFRRSTFPAGVVTYQPVAPRPCQWPASTGVLSSNCQSRHATGAARPRRSARTAVHPATSR